MWLNNNLTSKTQMPISVARFPLASREPRVFAWSFDWFSDVGCLCNLWLASRVLTSPGFGFTILSWKLVYRLLYWSIIWMVFYIPQGFLLQFLLTNAKLVYARGYIVAVIFKLSHFIIPNNNACGTPFIDNVIRGVPVCKVNSNQFVNKSRIRYTMFIYFIFVNSESLLKS